MRVVTVARVSTAGQAEHGYSLEDQDRSFALHCERNGHIRVEHVVDAGVSGRLADRPGLRRIWELIDARVVECVVFIKADRLGRSQRIILNTIHDIKSRGIQVEFVEHASGRTKDERLQIGVLASVAEHHWETIRELTMAGRYNKARSGRLPGVKPPYGYRLITRAEAAAIPHYAGRDGEVEILEAEAVAVRRIFELAAAGYPDRQIARALDDEGFPPAKSKLWDYASIGRIIQQPAYKGTLYFARHHCIQANGYYPSNRPRIVKVPRDRAEWAEIPVPLLVSPEVWQALNDRRAAEKASRKGRPSGGYLLRGIVLCGVCRLPNGEPRRCVGQRRSNNPGRASYEWRYYACNSTVRYPVNCGTRFRLEDVEAEALAAARRVVQEPGYLARLAREAALKAREHEPDHAEELRLAEKELRSVNEQLGRLADQAALGVLPLDILRDKAGALTSARDALARRVDALKARALRHQDPEEAAASAESLAEWARERWDAAQGNRTLLQELLRRMVRVIIAKEQPIEVKLFFG